jgi:glutathione S-transferase
MKIQDFPLGPNPFRIRVVIAEKRLASQIEFVKVDLPAAEHKQPAFLALNPTGTVPVLELDDGTFISECTAITEYLDNLDRHPTLTGTTPRDKGMIHMMQKRAESEFLDPVGIYFHHSTPGLGPLLQIHKSPEWSDRSVWGNRQRGNFRGAIRELQSRSPRRFRVGLPRSLYLKLIVRHSRLDPNLFRDYKPPAAEHARTSGNMGVLKSLRPNS